MVYSLLPSGHNFVYHVQVWPGQVWLGEEFFFYPTLCRVAERVSGGGLVAVVVRESLANGGQSDVHRLHHLL